MRQRHNDLTLTLRACAMALLFFLIGVLRAEACEYNSDCGYGSNCVKSGFSQYGVCSGGSTPGNSYDSQPVYNRYDKKDNVGTTCTNDTDCYYGSCSKSGYSTYGVCR
jgi:hypothetical protein